VKGCSSLGRSRYAVLLHVDGNEEDYCLVDLKEAVKDPMGVWIATGALGRVRLLNHPLWRRPCKLQLTEPMRRPLSKQIFPQFLRLWNSADLPG
jgi:hypothetical protein